MRHMRCLCAGLFIVAVTNGRRGKTNMLNVLNMLMVLEKSR